jgi:hypothetical protein
MRTSCITVCALVALSWPLDAAKGTMGGIAATGRQQEIVVTRDDSSIPDRCRPRRVARVVLRFLEALKRGDHEALEAFFERDFKWFSVTNSPVRGHRKHFVARNPEKAIRYITERRGFKLRLSEIMVDAAPTLRRSDIAYDGIWSVRKEDVARRWRFVGKGAINCRAKTIKTWSMAVSDEVTDPVFCPLPADGVKPRVVIACVAER